MLREEMQKIFSGYGFVSDATVESLKIAMGNKRMTDDAIDLEGMKKYIECIGTVIYLDKYGRKCNKDSQDNKYIWVSIGVENERGENLWFAFWKCDDSKEYNWYYCSTLSRLEANLGRFLKDKGIKVPKFKTNDNDIKASKGIEEDGIDRKLYEMCGVEDSLKKVVKQYLLYANCKLEKCKEFGTNVILNKNGDKILYKIPFRDKYGCDIYIIQEYVNGKLGSRIIANSEVELVKKGFDKAMVWLKPFKLVEDPSELLFNWSIDEINIKDGYALKHIIEERADRLPQGFSDMTPNRIRSCIEGSVEYSVQRSMVDFRWVAPLFDGETCEVKYMIPLYKDGNYGGKAESCIVLCSIMGVKRIATVLTVDMVKDRACALSYSKYDWM